MDALVVGAGRPGRLVPAIGVTLAVPLPAAYAFPALATALTPRRTIPGTGYAGHFISRHATRAGIAPDGP